MMERSSQQGGGETRKGFPLVASDYKLFEEIGQGASAIVYRGLCVPLNEVVAVKTLNLEKCNSNLDDIRREAMTMSLISHANVVKAHCSFVVDQNLWVVMPYLAGGSCLHIMKAAFPDGFDEPVIATVLKETLKAIEYLHRQGHIHRDVKAGNILIDGNGAVKLGDFGVSACMFDTGDRQRSRNTFVGTPCWMAPEVMEQLHGYDFKADIWSFGITALELAHGHAPFSKFPPMKVLLMTMQNAPPGLDYDRDKRFSKSFKEMIAMCLVKDPAKRPTAEKLSRHSFFKQARSADYIARHVLEGLPPLGERVKNLKIKDAKLLAQKEMPYMEQEERSQSEYKRGVSSWNFNVEDLKMQAAMIQDDDNSPTARKAKEVEEVLKQVEEGPKSASRGTEGSASSSPKFLPKAAEPSLSRESSSERFQVPVTIHSITAETANDAGERVTRIRSGPSSNPVQPKSGNSSKSGTEYWRKEPTHIGRFDVFEDDPGLGSPKAHGSPREHRKSEDKMQPRQEKEEGEHRKDDERERYDDGSRDFIRRISSFSHVSDRGVQSYRGREEVRDRDRERDHRHSGRTSEEYSRTPQRERSFNGPFASVGDRSVMDHRPANGHQGGSRSTLGTKDITEEKTKVSSQKGPVLHKGRFSVTSDDVDLKSVSIHKSASVGDLSSVRRHPQAPPAPGSLLTHNFNLTTPIAALVPQLQHIYHCGQKQQEALTHLLNSLSPSDTTSFHSFHSNSRYSRNSSLGSSGDFLTDVSDRERDLLHQVSELQARVTTLMDELQNAKLKSVGLERQLNAIYNREEEERIRMEVVAKEER
ncbi:unnamed protein product [Sphagnum troendelagicum]|uniref:Protein kinase domain-containing protein n=1 Tax=Sphagnum troendelagicum TaxID=128251 RepID=A0ABP0TGM5_9BRYO